jgi:uncharacterized protein
MLSTVRSDGKLALKLLTESPLDEGGCKPDREEVDPIQHWVPSRFNVHATTEDGRLILWNTLSTAISVFKAEQVSYVLHLLGAAGFESRQVDLAGYLVERGYLIRRGTNEYRKFLLRFGEQHYRSDRMELILLSSEDCNFRCTYCYEDFARGTMLPEVRQGIKRLVEDRIKHLRVLNVQWFGGEPLYGWAAIADLGPFFKEIAEKYEIPYGSAMTTNGYLLTPDVVDHLLEWKINGFQITLDGVAEDHDCSRPTRDGQGSFGTIFENITAMARRSDDFRVSLRVNFDQKNHTRFGEFVDLLERQLRGDQRFILSPHAVGRWGGTNDAELAVCGEDEQYQVMRELKAAASQRGLRVSTLRDMNYVGGQVCYAARPFNLIIGASGKVMKCTVLLDKDENNVVGRLTDDGKLILNDDRMALWTEPSFEHDHQCQKCAVLPSCQGISCPLPRIASGQRPCISTRTQSKEQLFEVLKYPSRAARTREVVEGRPHSAGK